MLFLHFQIGDHSFALAAHRIVEIVPLTEFRKMRRMPDAASHCFEYRGRYVPMVDLCALELGRPARQWLSTRIIVIRHPAVETILIGLVAERATEMLRLEPAEFAPSAAGPHGLIQQVEPQDLLSEPLLSFLSEETLVAG
jgi:chemotaxis-related protein WspB